MATRAKGTSGAKRKAKKKPAAKRASEESMSRGEQEVGAGLVAAVESNVQRVTNYRQHTKAKLSKAFPKIVDNMLNKAADGTLSDAKTKMLLELGGVKDEPKKRGSRKREPSLGRFLLDELARRREEKQKQAVVGASAVEEESSAELKAGLTDGTGAADEEEAQRCAAETQE